MNLKKFGKRAKSVLAFVLAITMFFGGWANYDFSVLAADELTVKLSSTEAVYTGGDLKPSIESVKEGDVDVAYTAEDVKWTNSDGSSIDGAIVNAGLYTVSVSVTENVVDEDGEPTGETKTRSGKAQFTVNPINLAGCTVNVAGSYTYKGTEIVPDKDAVTVTNGSTTVDKSLYTVEAANNLNASKNASVTVKAVGDNVKGEATGTFEIAPVVFDVVWNTKEYVFDGSTDHYPTATVNGVAVEKCGEAVDVGNGITVTLSTSSDKTVNPGNYTATLTLGDNSGNYKLEDGKATCAYTVEQKALNENDVNVVLSSVSAVANGEDHTPTVVVTVADKELVEGTDYTVEKAAEMIKAGSYDIKVKGQGNYEGEVTKKFVISFANDVNATVEVAGNTFNNNVYTGELTVTPANGYEVSEAEDGTYGASLTYDASSVIPEKLYLKNPANNNEISEIDFPVAGLSFDNEAPTLAVNEPDAETWASSKEVGLEADGTGSGYSVYYVEGTKVELPSPINKDTDLSGLKKLSGNLKIEENLEAAKSFYFYVIDDAGNVFVSEEVVVDKVDTEKPVITVDPSATLKDKIDADGNYWKKAEELVIPISVSENLSGIKEIKVTGTTDTAVLYCPITTNKLTPAGIVTIKDPGTYTISVVDEAGLEAEEQTFVVKEDTKAPEVALEKDQLSGTNQYHDEETDVYWFSENTVTLPITVTDELGGEDEELSTYKVEYSTDKNFAASTEVEVADNAGTAAITIGVEDGSLTYYFRTVDFAGNEGEIQEITLGYDNSAAEIAALELTQLNGDQWINAAEFNGESKVAFSVTINEPQSGIASIQYSADGGNSYEEAVYTATDNVYTFVTNEAYEDGTEYKWSVLVTNNVTAVATSAVEPGDGKIDTSNPSSEAYIQFFADTVGSNKISEGVGKTDGNGKWASDILSMAGNAWNKIWGKKTIEFEVYVTDKTSGIKGPEAVVMTYTEPGSKRTETITLEAVSGVQAFDAEDLEKSNELKDSGYSIFKGSIQIKEDAIVTLSANDFRIASITDIAGNVTENIVLNSAEEGDIIYIDAETPKLVDITYSTESGQTAVTFDGVEKDFYNETVYANITVEERFFGEDGVYPTIKLTTSILEASLSVSTDVETTKEDWTSTGGYGYVYKLPLKLEPEFETEYSFVLAYTDPSGNALASGNDALDVKDGKYATTRNIVIDNAAPKLSAYSFTTATCELALSANENATVIKNNTESADFEGNFTIDDTAAYYELTKDNLVVNVLNSTDKVLATYTVADLTEVSKNNYSHTYKFTFDGEENVEDEYYVTIEYKDTLDTSMVSGENLNKCDENGKFTSDKYVIDHVNPVFDVTYSAAKNVVNENGQNADTPRVGYKAYYNEQIDVEITLNEKYDCKDGNALKHFDLSVTKDGEDVTDKVSVTWTLGTDSHKAAFTIAPDENLKDGDYQFVVKYHDCAENAMVANADNADLNGLMSTDGVDGIYTSPILVLDTEAPQVKTYYSTVESRLNDGRDYFNANTTFKIEVVDRNIRYSDLLPTLNGVTAVDVDGKPYTNAVENIQGQVKAYSDMTQKVECTPGTVAHEGWTVDLALTEEANYTIPVAFTDLAGNEAVITAVTPDGSEKNTKTHQKEYVEKVTLDRTPVSEYIFIDFESDVLGSNTKDTTFVYDDVAADDYNEAWYSKIVAFVKEGWNRIWGRQTISYKVYSRDEVSGIFELEMSYKKDGEEVTVSSTAGTLKKSEEYLVIAEDGSVETGTGDGAIRYDVYSGSFTIETGDVSITDFQITLLEDFAKNIRDASFANFTNNVTSNALLYLDNVAPELLSVKIADTAVDTIAVGEDNKFFYNNAENVQFEIKERFFAWDQENAPVYPEVVVKGRNYNESNSEFEVKSELNKNAWTDLQNDYKWNLTEKVNLPTVDNTEMEYRLEMFYKDPSDNLMVGAENLNVVEGTFSSDIYVIDTLAPKLKSFVITDTTEKTTVFPDEDGIYYAKNNEDGADVKITVTIDDNANYFNEENVGLFYRDDEEGEWKSLTLNGWSRSGREHTASCTFDGEKNEEHTYRFKVVYFDRAGNAMVNDGATAAGAEAGAFISNQQVVIDHCTPKMSKIQYTEPVQIFDGEERKINGTVTETITDAASRMYYDADTTISFDIDDKYLKASDMTINIYQREDKDVSFGEKPVKVYAGNDKAVEDAFEFTMPAEDAEYYFTISYIDRAGNKMEYAPESVAVSKLQEKYPDSIADATYTSPIIIRDNITPVLDVTYTANGKEITENGTYNNVKTVTAVIDIDEMNLDMAETTVTVTAVDINGAVIECDELEDFERDESKNYIGSWSKVVKAPGAIRDDKNKGPLINHSLEMTFRTEAFYTVTVKVVDKVTKKVSDERTFYIDRTAPTITIIDKNGEAHENESVPGILINLDKSDISYKVEGDGKFAQMLNKLTFGYFANVKVIVDVKVHDQISGVKELTYSYKDVDGTYVQETVTRSPENGLKLLDKEDKSCYTFSFKLNGNQVTFKGDIDAYGTDMTANVANPSSAKGVIVETESLHESTSDAKVEVVSSYSKTPEYFNGDVKIKFTSQDSYSGLYSIDYVAGNDLKETVNYNQENPDKPHDAGTIAIVNSAVERPYTINASTNNENNIKLGLKFIDNADHEKEVPENELPKINIDTTPPKVEVEYDNNDFLNEKYYKADRIATVTVTERNFDPNDVEFDVTGPTVAIGTWAHTAGAGCTAGSDPRDTHHSDFCRWSCTVHFSLDGDYLFGFRCVDLAGNEGKYDRVDEFTIDQTFPEITVEYDNNDYLNEFYYKEARTATITIEEHNFSANDVIITMTAKDDGRTISVPSVSGWSSAGDIHTARIHYNYDAEFTFDIEFMDLAGNEADDYEEDHFVVDMTAPELEIYDIENMSANNGVVRPGIRYYDTNYDKDGTVILMTGYHNGVVEMTGDRRLQANGLELKLNDFAYVPEMDDIYTMDATVYDLAGNSSEATVIFSVNRFGSVYTFDEATEALIGENGSYYTKEAQDLVITETNVDTLEFKEITMNMNGKLTTLKEGVDYTVKASGSEVTWKQYTYTIKAKNFTDEGTYILTIYSEDRATNISDNNTKGKKVEFVLDKTNPNVLISGVETNGQYRTAVQNMTIDIDDNVRVGSLKVVVDGVETIYDAKQIAEADGKIVVGVGAKNHAQDIEVTVTDAAGNAMTEYITNVRVNANLFVLFYLNKPLFFGTIGGSAAIVAGLWWFLVGKKKKDEEQAK